MIDLHSHVLPGIDDGPDNIEDSLDMVAAAASYGTTLLAATPHLRDDHPEVDPYSLAQWCDGLNDRIATGLDIQVVPGGEVDLVWALDASDEELRLASLGQHGHDLLLETPYGELSDGFEEALFKVALRGFRILLAHPERNRGFQRQPDRLRNIAARGILIQVTVPSLVKRDKRSHTRALAIDLVREGLAHNLASDSHSAGSWRSPDLSAGVDALAGVAPAYAEWMVTDAAAAILEGEPLPRPPSSQAPKRRLRFPGLGR